MVLCMGCMNEINENETYCPYCGFKRGTPREEEYFLETGTILQDRYIIGRVIGHGGFGITYIGYDGLLNRKVAVKEYFYRQCVTRESGTNMVKVYTGDASWQFRMGLNSFIAEARQLAGFTRVPEIADIYDVVSANGTGYIIMEYVQGKDVRKILQENGTMTYEDAERIIVAVARGLSAVHRAGIIHRDIAPDNIMISNDGEIKLVDFGAARQVVAAYSQNLSVIFKAGYAPVEQYQEKGHQGSWTDIYALGATMYRMLTGVKPQPSVDRIVTDELKRPSELGVQMPPYSESILMKSMAVRDGDRIQTTEEFARELLRWHREPGVNPVPKPPKQTDTEKPPIWQSVLVFVLVMLFTAGLTWGGLNLAIEKSLPFGKESSLEMQNVTKNVPNMQNS